MFSIKILQYISSLSEEDYKTFSKFVLSDILRTQRDYSRLLKGLKFLRKENFFNYNEKECIKYLTKNLKITKQTLLIRFSGLYKYGKIFLSYNRLLKDKNYSNIYLLNELSDKKMEKLFEYTRKEFENNLNTQPVSYEVLKAFSDLYYVCANHYFSILNMEKYQYYFKKTNLMHEFKFLYSLMFGYIEATQMDFNGLKNNYPEMKLPDINYKSLFSKADSDKLQSFMYVFYYCCLCFLDFENESYYKKARDFHNKLFSKTNRYTNNIIYSIRINYCINQVNNKKFQFRKELFNIINEKLNNNYFEELSVINYPINNFRDYIFIALSLNEVDWVRNFIEKYSVYLPQQYKQDELNISIALLFIEEEKYYEALLNLNKIRKSNFIYYIDAGLYTLRCMYYLSKFVEGMDEIKKIKSYLSYHKNIPEIFLKNTNAQLDEINALIKFKLNLISKEELTYFFHNKPTEMLKRWINKELIKLDIRRDTK